MLLFTLFYSLINLVVDLLYGLDRSADPAGRRRASGEMTISAGEEPVEPVAAPALWTARRTSGFASGTIATPSSAAILVGIVLAVALAARLHRALQLHGHQPDRQLDAALAPSTGSAPTGSAATS